MLLQSAELREVATHVRRQDPVRDDQVAGIAEQVEVGERALGLRDRQLLEREHDADGRQLGIGEQLVQAVEAGKEAFGGGEDLVLRHRHAEHLLDDRSAHP